MTWLLMLYPAGWRRRYRAEVADLIAAQPFSVGAALDLVAGAVDAWLNPHLVTQAAPAAKGDPTMTARVAQLICSSQIPMTPEDRSRSRFVTIGGTFLLTVVGLAAQWQLKRNAYLTALWPMAYFFPYLLSHRYTRLKHRSARTQAIVIGGTSVLLAGFFLLIGWLGTMF